MSRTLLKLSSCVKVVIDDESYFPLGPCQIPGNDRFYSKNKEKTPLNIRYYEKKKFEPKLLVWLAISQEEHSELFFVPSGGNINGDVYWQECIMRPLIPFLHEHHAHDNYILWPDLASSHYANDPIAFLHEENICHIGQEQFIVNRCNNPSVTPGLVYMNLSQSK